MLLLTSDREGDQPGNQKERREWEKGQAGEEKEKDGGDQEEGKNLQRGRGKRRPLRIARIGSRTGDAVLGIKPADLGRSSRGAGGWGGGGCFEKNGVAY